MTDYRKHAEELAKPLVDAIKMTIIKQHKVIIEEMHDQLKVRDREIERLKTVLRTAIAWQEREYGVASTKQLLDMLEDG